MCPAESAKPLPVPRPIVVHTRLLVKFLCVEEIRRVPYAVALLYEHLSERHILDVLHNLAFKVGDEAGASEMVGMVEELQVLIVVRVFERLGYSTRPGFISF